MTFTCPKVSSCLNWYPTTPWPNQRYVSLFVLIWMVSIPFRSMTSIKENAFEIWRANLHYFRATLIIVVNKVLCCARRGHWGVRKIGKYRNTVSKIDEMPIPHLWSVTLYPSRVFVYLKHVCTRNEPQTLRENVGLIGATIEKPDRLCDHLPLSLRS